MLFSELPRRSNSQWEVLDMAQNATDQQLEQIRQLWNETEEGRRVPDVHPDEELEFYINSTMISLELRFEALGGASAPESSVNQIANAKKEINLCTKIALYALRKHVK
jgi:hypothetical protein